MSPASPAARATIPDADFIVALTTLQSASDARKLVRELVERRIIACGTVLAGGKSIYRWASKITETSEAVVLMKTRRERWTALESVIRERHPYEVPELLALPVQAGLSSYLGWLTAETTEDAA
ncbi:MAG TPA: divalent-cation tolerance protein CutA [Gemmatimonadales bacterium]|nr:divalent-cation tolerance protein CutA [Gemmatimonadales bacterium]